MNKFGISRKKKAIMFSIFVGLIISIVTLTVVYASLSTALTITGSTDVVASNWNVYLDNGAFTTTIPSVSNGTGGSQPISNIYDYYKIQPLNNVDDSYRVVPLASDTTGTGGNACSSGTDCISYMSGTTGSFTTASISKPGDFKAISFDVVNAGNIDAKLDGYTLSGISSAQDVYLNYYILYSDGTTPTAGNILTAGSTKKMVLVIEFDDTVTSSQLPTTNQSLSLSFTLNYVQN